MSGADSSASSDECHRTESRGRAASKSPSQREAPEADIRVVEPQRLQMSAQLQAFVGFLREVFDAAAGAGLVPADRPDATWPR